MIQHAKTRIVVAQGHCLLREALLDRLEREAGVEVCAVASDAADIAIQLKKHRPHILVLHTALMSCSGLSSVAELKRSHLGLSIIALSCDAEFEDVYIGQIMRAGADGYLSVEDSSDDFIAAIRTVGEGQSFLSKKSMQHLQAGAAKYNQLMSLSVRESEVFFLTGCGYSPQRIADKMNRSVKTIESYRERIRKKMDIGTGADLQYAATHFVRSATRRGIGRSDEDVVRELLSATG